MNTKSEPSKVYGAVQRAVTPILEQVIRSSTARKGGVSEKKGGVLAVDSRVQKKRAALRSEDREERHSLSGERQWKQTRTAVICPDSHLSGHLLALVLPAPAPQQNKFRRACAREGRAAVPLERVHSSHRPPAPNRLQEVLRANAALLASISAGDYATYAELTSVSPR